MRHIVAAFCRWLADKVLDLWADLVIDNQQRDAGLHHWSEG